MPISLCEGCEGGFATYLWETLVYMIPHHRLVESVVDRARLESDSEAEGIIRAVTGSMVVRFSPAAWEVLSARIPPGLHGERSSEDRGGTPSASDLFEDVGERLRVDASAASRYVRVVTEAISESLTAADLERFQQFLADEYLALFEVDHRGELTEPHGITPGAAQVSRADEVEERDQRRN